MGVMGIAIVTIGALSVVGTAGNSECPPLTVRAAIVYIRSGNAIRMAVHHRSLCCTSDPDDCGT
jgi:hypothetical protein